MRVIGVFLFFVSIIYASESIKIGYQRTSLYAHIFWAKEKGYFKKEGVNVKLIPFNSSNKMMEAMLSGKIDVLGLTNFPVALKVFKKFNGPFRFVNFLVWDKDSYPDYIIAQKNSTIDSISDLKNKRVGLHPGSAVKGFFTALLNSNNIDINDVKIISLKPPIMIEVFTEKAVDALYCMDPVASYLIGTRNAKVIVKNPLGKLINDPIPIAGTAIANRLITKNPKIAEKIKIAIDKSIGDLSKLKFYDYLYQKILRKYTRIDTRTLDYMKKPKYWKLEEVDIREVERVENRLYELGILDAKGYVKKAIYWEK